MSNYVSRLSLSTLAKVAICALVANSQAIAQERQRPNIIVFVVDDMGYSDVGCFGSDYYETPHIDQLASRGMRFTDAYASSTLCSPTRASLLTGKNPARLHITHAIPIKGYLRIANGKGTVLKDADYVMNLPLEEFTIAEALKAAGYATASIGKWHVCNEPAYYPEHQGFDVNIGGDHRGSTGNYFYPYHNRWRMAEGYPWQEWNTLPDGKPGEYITDRLTDEALRFIRENQDQSFFLYLSHYAIHTPIQAKDTLISKYEKREPDSTKGHVKPAYAAMIQSVDESMGALMNTLKELGIDDNTIVLFTSDNGGHGKQTSNYPLRGNKGNFYEGGIRVPLIIRWPWMTDEGTESAFPVITTDFYPTLLEMVRLPLIPEQHVDGISLVRLLKGKEELEREALFWHFPNYTGPNHPDPSGPVSVVRYRNWKLIESLETGALELYNLKVDLAESSDVASSEPALVDSLSRMLAEWRIKAKVQMPQPNPDYTK